MNKQIVPVASFAIIPIIDGQTQLYQVAESALSPYFDKDLSDFSGHKTTLKNLSILTIRGLRPTDNPQGSPLELPGGTIEYGEDAKLTLAREVEEEAGIKLNLVDFQHLGNLAHRLSNPKITLLENQVSGISLYATRPMNLSEIDTSFTSDETAAIEVTALTELILNKRLNVFRGTRMMASHFVNVINQNHMPQNDYFSSPFISSINNELLADLY